MRTATGGRGEGSLMSTRPFLLFIFQTVILLRGGGEEEEEETLFSFLPSFLQG